MYCCAMVGDQCTSYAPVVSLVIQGDTRMHAKKISDMQKKGFVYFNDKV
jgi:hypothetical protein